jgi:thiol-disulfide isomerase/thioredoxin
MKPLPWLALVAMVALVVASAAPARAAQVQTYSKDAFRQAQAAGKPIVVFVTASWCPNCRKQQPVVDTISKDTTFADTMIFVVDFDSDKTALKDLNVLMQSTLIAFHGATERARSTAVTDPGAIRALFQKAL